MNFASRGVALIAVGQLCVLASSLVAGYCSITGEMANIRDAYANQRFNPESDRLTDFRTHNVLCVPVVDRRGGAAGAIQADNKIEGVFDDEDMRVLRAIASQIGVSVLLHS